MWLLFIFWKRNIYKDSSGLCVSSRAEDSQQVHDKDPALPQTQSVPGCPEHQAGVMGVGLSEGTRPSLERSPEFVGVAADGNTPFGSRSLQNLNDDPLLFAFAVGRY